MWGSLWGAWRCHLVWVCDFKELSAGPGPALVHGFQGENVYTFSASKNWSRTFLFYCITWTNKFKSSICYSQEWSPTHFLSWCVWLFISIRRLSYLLFLLYYLEEIEHIVSFHFGVISLAYSWLNQKREKNTLSDKPHPWFIVRRL